MIVSSTGRIPTLFPIASQNGVEIRPMGITYTCSLWVLSSSIFLKISCFFVEFKIMHHKKKRQLKMASFDTFLARSSNKEATHACFKLMLD